MKIIDINGIEREVKSVAPDPKYPGYVKVEFNRHHEWLSFNEFTEKNPDLTHLLNDTPNAPADVVGVISTATKNSIKDTAQDWVENVYIGMWLWISRGEGEGQKRRITKNTKNTLYLDKDWDIKPNKTSQYVISYHVNDSVRAMGNTLPQEDMKALERRAIQMDKDHGRLSSQTLKKTLKYLKPEEV
jgi:hypothetical protein